MNKSEQAEAEDAFWRGYYTINGIFYNWSVSSTCNIPDCGLFVIYTEK